MRTFFSLAVLLIFLFNFTSFSEEHHRVKLRYGENLLSIKISNNTSSLLKTVSAQINSNNLPKGITISVSNTNVSVNPNEKSNNSITLKINVSKDSKPGNFIVPIILKDSLNNKWSYTLELELTLPVIENFELEQNYPNPFNGTTIIKYSLPVNSQENVKLIIYDLLGQKIKTLVNEKQQAGNYSISWDGTDDLGKLCPSGIYLYKISTKTFQATKKMILLQ
jgi:uncharacterized membrane protein